MALSRLVLLVLVVALACLARRAHADSLRMLVHDKLENHAAANLNMGAAAAATTAVQLDALAALTVDAAMEAEKVAQLQQQSRWKQLPDWARYLLGTILCILGLILVFGGYFLVTYTSFVLGGYTLALLLFLILAVAISNNAPNKTTIVYATALGVWLAFGLLFALLHIFNHLSMAWMRFNLAFGFGANLSLAFQPLFLYLVWPANPVANVLVWVLVFGLLFATLALLIPYNSKYIIAPITAASGSFAVVASIMGMAGTLAISSNVKTVTWQQWAGFAGFFALAIVGSVVQICLIHTEDEDLNWRDGTYKRSY